MLIRSLIVVLAALSFVAAAPVQAAKCGGGTAGALVGGVLGGLLGAKIDGGRKNTFGTLVGGAIGALAGGAIGKALDRCEQEKLGKATETALNSSSTDGGSSQSWESDSRPGVRGTVSVGAPVTTADGRVCRAARRVNYIDGQEMADAPTYCRTPPNSGWALQAA
ncbi:glycine zipper 2TM domain-containing protein [Sphingomonas montanisoli]|uniref:17 kDa surface antigen n=1 Tax=Sphingomonas montanisoli TaxID=2606412 RepID=A0A5D9CD62_9SPHN|nr:glycine zipper 2TM domain-containing protein [Sphingomonas montanisoli]TZG29599.1 glycine zipper 2TM domain-containing protein [Sphingomonas montanisoli]